MKHKQKGWRALQCCFPICNVNLLHQLPLVQSVGLILRLWRSYRSERSDTQLAFLIPFRARSLKIPCHGILLFPRGLNLRLVQNLSLSLFIRSTQGGPHKTTMIVITQNRRPSQALQFACLLKCQVASKSFSWPFLIPGCRTIVFSVSQQKQTQPSS